MYLSRKVHDGLSQYFAGLEIEIGEDELCGVKETMEQMA